MLLKSVFLTEEYNCLISMCVGAGTQGIAGSECGFGLGGKGRYYGCYDMEGIC